MLQEMATKKRIEELHRKKKTYLSCGRPDLVSKVENKIRAVSTANIKETPLFSVKEPSDEEITIKTYFKTCSDCGITFYSPHKTTRQLCIYCKLKNGSISEAKKDLHLLIESDIQTKAKYGTKQTN